MERVQNGYQTDTEREVGMPVERQQNAFCQAFPIRFLLISTVKSIVGECKLCDNTKQARLCALYFFTCRVCLSFWENAFLHNLTLTRLTKSCWS